MGVVSDAFHYLTTSGNWSGDGSIGARLFEHIQVSGLSVGLASAVAIPAGLYIGHTRKGERAVEGISNLGRAIPSFAILALALPFSIRLGLGLGFWPTVLALFALAVPPILTNTHVGIRGVDAEMVEAARGMGMTGRQVLLRLEAPLAGPLIVSGVRTAAVQVIATATLAALVAWGGLGRLITDGFAVQDNAKILAGALLVAALAIAAELSLGALERLVWPQTSS
ncbi:MAG: ABC transporter permease [Actinomycetota bacterium]